MIYTIILIVIFVIVIGFSVNYLIYKRIVSRALRSFIKPYLESQQLKLTSTKFTGLFNNGDFDYGGITVTLVPEMGKFTLSTYIYVFTFSEDEKSIRFTAKIHCKFLFVRKVFLRTGKEKNEEIELPRVKIYMAPG